MGKISFLVCEEYSDGVFKKSNEYYRASFDSLYEACQFFVSRRDLLTNSTFLKEYYFEEYPDSFIDLTFSQIKNDETTVLYMQRITYSDYKH